MNTLNENERIIMKENLYRNEMYEAMMTIFKMFGNASRLKIMTILSKQPCSVNDLTDILGMSQSAVSQHLHKLREANLVKFEKVGLNIFYSLMDDHVMTIFEQALDHVVEECNDFHENN